MATKNSTSRVKREYTRVLEQVGKLINENFNLETKEEAIKVKRRKNDEEIRHLLVKLKELSRGAELVPDDGESVDVANPNEMRERNVVENLLDVEENPMLRDPDNYEKLRRMKKNLLEEIKTSGNNLKDHHDVLDTLERENGRDSVPWKNMCKQVRDYTRIHKMFKESRMKRIKEIEVKLGESDGQGTSFNMDSQEASSSKVDHTTEVTRRRFLNESVLDCGRIVKKISTRELSAITPTKLKVEEDHPEASFMCNFDYCTRTFTCASTLVSHLENHYAQDQARIDCPFPGCEFSHSKENLTTHMRARHTMEKLFSCQFCPLKFHTMVAKVTHEKKHSQNDVWAQCNKQHCMKFYQIARGNCKSCGKK